jgi:hypothetical protein
MTTKTPTIQGVRAKLKRSAAAAGLHLELSHSLKGYQAGVKVDQGYTQDARRAGLLHISDDDFTGTIMDWVRSVLTRDELLTVPVLVEVNNSEMQIDYFSTDWLRVLPDWDSYTELASISHRWAYKQVGMDADWSYDRGTHSFTCSETVALCPSAAHATALAACIVFAAGWRVRRAETLNRLAALDETGRSLFLSMIPDWAEGFDDLLDAVEALVPQAAPAPVEPAPAPEEDGPVDPELLNGPLRIHSYLGVPSALTDYFARLLHEPKRDYAVAVWTALDCDREVPHCAAPWALDVVRKVRRYANA